ncbi:aminotransferase class-III [Candidatus Vecturithrix granuli]|uniref:Aminotransferase class-III n=1 Tax=Vecturithrix granuli TaxID=1499967 RepID=A0A081BW74_VECG1|nr:aminotransferase class-III [Candidatus Vecturithrix granuli]
MNYRRLGRSELYVSAVGFGTCQLRLVPERQAIDTLKRGFQLGVNIVHTSPDYEGIEKLITAARRECHPHPKILTCAQGWGTREYFEQIFERSCAAFETDRLDLFGIASLYDRERFGENVWGKGGLVEFLQQKKAEGRIGAIFCNTHSQPSHIKTIIERDVFDVLMLSYNLLGFHLLTYNPDTLFDHVVPPPGVKGKWEFENIPLLKQEIFPLIEEKDLGLMIMEPLGGGLLCQAKAFPRYAPLACDCSAITASDILRTTLSENIISCVLPGTASVEEAAENALAGHGNFSLSQNEWEKVHRHIAILKQSVCSRCGKCDHTCSQGLSISWLFRAAYINMSRSVNYENFDPVLYFKLHPDEESLCRRCTQMTCYCPEGIDIRKELICFHEQMLELLKVGSVPGINFYPPMVTKKPYALQFISWDFPRSVRAGSRVSARVYVCNTGQHYWHADGKDEQCTVGLAVYLDGAWYKNIRLRMDVPSGERVYFAFTFDAPLRHGKHCITLDLFEKNKFLFSGHGCPQLSVDYAVVGFPDVQAVVRNLRFLCRESTPQYGVPSSLHETRAMDIQTSPPLQPYSVCYLEHNIPTVLEGNSVRCFRVKVQNTGTATWYRDPADNHFTGLALFLDGEHLVTGRSLREEVKPGESTVIALTAKLPACTGQHELKLDMVTHNVTMFENCGYAPLKLLVTLQAREQTASEQMREIAERRNFWFFAPSQGVCLSGDTLTYPLFAKSAKGYRIQDLEGREYIDYVMGWGCSLLGYANERIQAAIARELSSSGGVITLIHTLEMEVSEKLCALFPELDMVLFGKNGSDVCTAAVRMARAYTQKQKVLVCGYHGWQDWFAVQCGFRQSSVPEPPEPMTLQFPYLDTSTLKAILDQHAGNIAAVMLEPSSPVEGVNGPLRDAEPEYLREVARLTHDAGAVLIFDEILSGFRYLHGSVQRALGIVPDLLCLGKALSAGMPLSALVGKREIFNQTLHRLYYTPTFKDEVYSFAAAKEALQIYAEYDIPGHIWSLGGKLKDAINTICLDIGLPAEMIGPPFRMTLSFQEPDGEKRILLRTLLQQELLKHGILTFKGFMLPCFAHDHSAYEQTVEAFSSVLPIIFRAWENDEYLRYLEIPDVL